MAAGLSASVRLAAGQPRLRLMLALLTAEAAVVGALDLLFVILAVTVLGRPQAWAGYLNSAYGVGAILAATVGVLLVAGAWVRRSWPRRCCSAARSPPWRPALAWRGRWPC